MKRNLIKNVNLRNFPPTKTTSTGCLPADTSRHMGVNGGSDCLKCKKEKEEGEVGVEDEGM